MIICIIRSSLISNSISYDALFHSLNGDYIIRDIDESYFQKNDVSILEMNSDIIIVISDMKFIHSIPYSSKYVIIVDDAELPDEIDLAWHGFQTHRMISFSRATYEKIQSSGLKCTYFQYYPQPEVNKTQWTECDDILKLSVSSESCNNQASHIYNSAFSLDILNYKKRQIIEKEINLTEINKEMEDYDIFMISEYSYENLSAIMSIMACGKIVIANDVPWVSDYIGHLSSGIIDDGSHFLHHPCLSSKYLRAIGQGALHRTRTGHRRWLADRTRLLSLIMNDGQRWSGSDRSASFGNRIRRAASNTAYETASPQG